MIKVLFITFAPLSSNLGHLRRFKVTLPFMSSKAEVHVLCLHNNNDQDSFEEFPAVTFHSHEIEFNGWSVKNVEHISSRVNDIVVRHGIELVVCQMEVWDLIRHISQNLERNVAFASVINAMPFLGSPIVTSKDFTSDVKSFLATDIQEYRKRYIQDHYVEADEVLHRVNIISNNLTVDFYLKNYFPDLLTYVQSPLNISVDINNGPKSYRYDLALMARIEKGKGIGYIKPILLELSDKLKRPVSIAIMGKADDTYSRNEIDSLIALSNANSAVNVDFLGWADKATKENVFNQTAVFVYPSYYDTAPVALIEAVSAGLPSVVWDVPFSRFCYKHVKGVVKVPFDDIHAFTDAIIYSLANRDRLSHECLIFSQQLQTYEQAAEHDVNVLNKIVRNREAN